MLDSKKNRTEKLKSLNGQLERRLNLDWSLKPLIGLMKLLSGISLRTTKDSKSKTVMKNVFFTSWAALPIVSNILINGVNCINNDLYVWEASEDVPSDSPWGNFFYNPHALLELTHFYLYATFFYFVPATHFIFFVIVSYSPMWKDLLATFQDIYRDRKLTKFFYRKCRVFGNLSILLLVTVKEVFISFLLIS